ncbi:MAG: bifunctional oligoribonuclease/PAP phosphatase NrnA [Endomicrobium sp.]|jgi:phosphoesterase RecJ-like protein|nr:bifunctional oligoribonuclease/PAP phosphatase NrnA [Endomicrobium sp.]
MKPLKTDLKKLKAISEIIKKSKTFFIAGHVKPDGDSLGSALALRSVLTRLGKNAAVYCADDVPPFLTFLKNSKTIKKSVKQSQKFDCAIILESVDFARMGNIIAKEQAKKIINIDHHSMFTSFGDVNYVFPNASSTAELVFSLFEYMKIKLTKDEADCLYTGIVTDTGRFQQLNTTAQAHTAAAKLLETGVKPEEICANVYGNVSLGSLKLLGLALLNIKTNFNGQFAYSVLTKDMFKQSGAQETETEGIINFLLSINGVKAACLFKEVDANSTKISFRSIKTFDVLDIAKRCGGGGHKTAAGCSLKQNVSQSVEYIKKILKGKINA